MSFDENRYGELNNALRAKMAANHDLSQTFKIEDGRVIVSTDQKSAFDSNMKDIKEIKSLIDFMEMGRDINGGDSAPTAASVAAAIAAGQTYQGAVSAKTLGEMFVDSPEFKALNGGAGGYNMAQPFQLKTGNLGSMWGGVSQKDVYTALPSGTPGSFGRIERDPMILPPMRTRRVRDLFPIRSTNASIIEYFQMSGFTNAASTVAERNVGNTAFGLKPQSSIAFVGQQSPVRTLAHWEAIHRNVLADEPQLRSIIDNELLYGLRLVEDDQILNGNGVGENLLGIRNAGIQQYSWSSGATLPVPDTKADAVRRAATLAYLAFYEPTGVVVHPNDWEDIELTKNSQGTYLFAVSIQLGGEARMWRMPVVDTPAMTEGHALVGAFGTGAQIYDRESANIRIAEQHADFFVRNAIVVLAEERLALAVKRPEAFVDVTFNMAPA